MKNIIIILFLSFFLNPGFAQKIIDKKLSWSNEQLVNLNLRFGDSIRVRYWDKAEVSIRMQVTINGAAQTIFR